MRRTPPTNAAASASRAAAELDPRRLLARRGGHVGQRLEADDLAAGAPAAAGNRAVDGPEAGQGVFLADAQRVAEELRRGLDHLRAAAIREGAVGRGDDQARDRRLDGAA